MCQKTISRLQARFIPSEMGREFVSDFADTPEPNAPISSHRGFYIQKDSRRGVGRTYGSF